jgi:hypothetical protein
VVGPPSSNSRANSYRNKHLVACFTQRTDAPFYPQETVVRKTILFDESVAGGVVSFERDGKREVGY